MKRIIYFMAALLFCAASINAQVRIGSNDDPHQGAILDLKSDETTGKGVLFPHVSLTNLETFLPVEGTAIEGMTVYNTNTAIGKGIYVWNGEEWLKAGGVAETTLSGTPSDWTVLNPTPNSGEGTESNPYTNACPATTVMLAAQDGYTLGTITPADAATLFNGTLTFTKSGNVAISKGSKSSLVYVSINNCVVDIPVESVSLSSTTATITVGDTQQLTETVTPTTATNKAVTWSSNNPSVATVSTSGLVTATTPGTATITVETADGNKTATCVVIVNAATPAGFSFAIENGVYEKNYSGNYLTTLSVNSNASAVKTYFTAVDKTLYVQDEDISTNKMTWSAAVNACSAIGSRLPTLYELAQLQNSYISYGLQRDAYWSSTEYNSGGEGAWYWNFMGIAYPSYNSSDYYNQVRCVKD